MYNSYNSSNNAYKINKHNLKTPVRYSRTSNKTQVSNIPSRSNSILLVVIISFAILILMNSAVRYINEISLCQTNNKLITKLSSELNTLKENNDNKKLIIDSSINYEEIYNTAINELGMVYPNSNNLIKYESGASEYVIQYKSLKD